MFSFISTGSVRGCICIYFLQISNNGKGINYVSAQLGVNGQNPYCIFNQFTGVWGPSPTTYSKLCAKFLEFQRRQNIG